MKMNDKEIVELRTSDKKAKGICDHEFPQSVIDACEPKIQATIQRIINGETTFEIEEAKLLAEWNALVNP
jgi:hypothetical protein